MVIDGFLNIRRSQKVNLTGHAMTLIQNNIIADPTCLLLTGESILIELDSWKRIRVVLVIPS